MNYKATFISNDDLNSREIIHTLTDIIKTFNNSIIIIMGEDTAKDLVAEAQFKEYEGKESAEISFSKAFGVPCKVYPNGFLSPPRGNIYILPNDKNYITIKWEV